jgi:F0F1-type ATP synthase delta subunit
MYENILSILKTKQQADLLVDDLVNLKTLTYKSNGKNINDLITQNLGIETAQEVIKFMATNKPDNFEDFIESLIKAIKSRPVLTLTIAFEPRVKSIDRFHGWITQNVSKDIILDIEVDQSIVGGAQITFKGKYADYSLINILEHELNKNAQQYYKMLNQKENG